MISYKDAAFRPADIIPPYALMGNPVLGKALALEGDVAAESDVDTRDGDFDTRDVWSDLFSC